MKTTKQLVLPISIHPDKPSEKTEWTLNIKEPVRIIKHVTKHTFSVGLFAGFQKVRTFAMCFS